MHGVVRSTLSLVVGGYTVGLGDVCGVCEWTRVVSAQHRLYTLLWLTEDTADER